MSLTYYVFSGMEMQVGKVVTNACITAVSGIGGSSCDRGIPQAQHQNQLVDTTTGILEQKTF
jgi:hypothetical protein